LLERNQRAVPSHVATKLASVLGMSPTVLPVRDGKSLKSDQAAGALGALGYEPFGYLPRKRRVNPAEVLLAVLRADDVDARVVQALPWLVVRYADLNWDLVVRCVKQDDGQNRLGFVLTLGKGLAESLHDSKAPTVLANGSRSSRSLGCKKTIRFREGQLPMLKSIGCGCIGRRRPSAGMC
jgi:hypothetical protein